MNHMRQVFIALFIEMVLVLVLGIMTIDNNYCDAGYPWRWSYYTSSDSAIDNQQQCGMINVNVQSSEGRFVALVVMLVTIPVTAAYGFVVADHHHKKESLEKRANPNTES